MTIEDEITKELFNEKIIDSAKKLYSSSANISSVGNELPLRLYKTKDGTINLELIAKHKFFNKKNGESTFHDFAQPIGYYNIQKGIFKTNTQIIIINQFEKSYNYLSANNLINNSLKVNKLTFNENILIGAVSLEASLNAELLIDTSFISNGFNYDLFMTLDNEYPQCFLDDKYDMSDPLVGYLFREINRPINPMVKFEKEFNSLYKRELLTAYRKF